MSESEVYHLDILIDHLTNSIRNVATGESFSTEITEVNKSDLKEVTKTKGWHFSWKSEFVKTDRKVYRLVITERPAMIQGLVSISDMGDHYYLHLAKAHQLTLVPAKRTKEWVEICLLFAVNSPGTKGMKVLLHFNLKLN